MNAAVKLGVTAICAVALTGCDTLSFDSSVPLGTNKIRVISRRHASECRLISQAEGVSVFPPEDDLYAAAFAQARTKAAELSANAVMVRSYQVLTRPGGSRATLSADIYSCPEEKGGE